MKTIFILAWALAAFTAVMATDLTPSPDRFPAVGHSDTPFDPRDQLIDITGAHKFMPPVSGDARGPCPGLNALANHGYISRDGVTNFDELTKAMVDVFAFDKDTSEFLTILGLGTSGSGDLWTLSIGGHHPRTDENITYPLKVPTRGLSGTHIIFETDASPTRLDLYDSRAPTHPDDVHMNMDFFQQLFDRQVGIADEDVDFSLEVVAEHKFARTVDSVENNPYMFLSPDNAAMGSMAAHLFIPNIYANHSADHPNGRLSRDSLMSFFGVSEDSQLGLQYASGHERIPDNWYRRHSTRPYRVQDLNADILYVFEKHPALLNDFFFGGNADGRADNFRSLDIDELTGGNYTKAGMLTEPFHPVCFAFASGPVFTRPFFNIFYGDIEPVGKAMNEKIVPIIKPLGCPRWLHLNHSVFEGLRGYERVFHDFEFDMLS